MSKKRIIIITLLIIIFAILIILSFFQDKGKYVITFETGTEDVILNQYLSKNSKVKKPISPVKDGYIFIGWQLDDELYDFNSNVSKNMNLTAKWMKEEYIVIFFNTGSLYEISNLKILKGTSITALPSSYKEGYDFEAWYYNDNIYSGQILYDDTELIAKYKSKSFEVGDSVIIVDSYASSAMDDTAYYNRAIGWKRKIMFIIEGENYPYAVGDNSGITGFFSQSSIKKIEGD